MKKQSIFQNPASGFSFQRAVIFIFTLAILALAGCEKESDIAVVPIDDDDCLPELVSFDYRGDRVAIEHFYRQNLRLYWASYGFPALSNLSKMLSELGETNTQSPFDGAAVAFSAEMFSQALELGQLPEPVVQDYFSLPASNPWFAVLKSIRRYGEQIYNATSQGNPAAAHLARDELEKLIFLCFDPEKLLELSVVAEKELDVMPPDMVNIRLCCGEDHLSNMVQQPPAGGVNPDLDRIRWTDITGRPWRTPFNGACAALATGACAHKLNLLSEDVDSTGWNDLSRGIGAVPEGGANVTGNPSIESWFSGRGYGRTSAHDGLAWGPPPYIESASEEAKRALDRGCDVMLWYKNGNGSGHIEVVTAIDIDPNDPKKSTVRTLSWGQSATTTFRSGKFSNKSDGRSYRPEGQNKGWLEGEGEAELIYFCKK
jgi:hypothetical protein